MNNKKKRVGTGDLWVAVQRYWWAYLILFVVFLVVMTVPEQLVKTVFSRGGMVGLFLIFGGGMGVVLLYSKGHQQQEVERASPMSYQILRMAFWVLVFVGIILLLVGIVTHDVQAVEIVSGTGQASLSTGTWGLLLTLGIIIVGTLILIAGINAQVLARGALRALLMLAVLSVASTSLYVTVQYFSDPSVDVGQGIKSEGFSRFLDNIKNIAVATTQIVLAPFEGLGEVFAGRFSESGVYAVAVLGFVGVFAVFFRQTFDAVSMITLLSGFSLVIASLYFISHGASDPRNIFKNINIKETWFPMVLFVVGVGIIFYARSGEGDFRHIFDTAIIFVLMGFGFYVWATSQGVTIKNLDDAVSFLTKQTITVAGKVTALSQQDLCYDERNSRKWKRVWNGKVSVSRFWSVNLKARFSGKPILVCATDKATVRWNSEMNGPNGVEGISTRDIAGHQKWAVKIGCPAYSLVARYQTQKRETTDYCVGSKVEIQGKGVLFLGVQDFAEGLRDNMGSWDAEIFMQKKECLLGLIC